MGSPKDDFLGTVPGVPGMMREIRDALDREASEMMAALQLATDGRERDRLKAELVAFLALKVRFADRLEEGALKETAGSGWPAPAPTLH